MSLPALWKSRDLTIGTRWAADNDVTLYHGDCRELLAQVPDGSVQLVVTSPPYNIGKSYERRVDLDAYLRREKGDQCLHRQAQARREHLLAGPVRYLRNGQPT